MLWYSQLNRNTTQADSSSHHWTCFWSCNPIEPSVLMLSNYRLNHLIRAERVGSNLAANFTNLMYGLVNPNKDEENG